MREVMVEDNEWMLLARVECVVGMCSGRGNVFLLL